MIASLHKRFCRQSKTYLISTTLVPKKGNPLGLVATLILSNFLTETPANLLDNVVSAFRGMSASGGWDGGNGSLMRSVIWVVWGAVDRRFC